MLTDAEFERRKPVWTAFSEFWLPTELEDADLYRIARIAAASGYTVSELRDIYFYEVAPLALGNRAFYIEPGGLSGFIAGMRAGYDEKWFHAEARKRAEHGSLSADLFGIGRRMMTYGTERYWRRIVALLQTGNDPKDG